MRQGKGSRKEKWLFAMGIGEFKYDESRLVAFRDLVVCSILFWKNRFDRSNGFCIAFWF